MAIRSASLFVLAVAFAAAAPNTFRTAQAGDASSASAFDRFKALQGEWIAKPDKTGNAPKLRCVFKVTSAGSAVEETMLPGTKHEMINMIHPDGDGVVLTHYCAAGNQPEMKAPDKTDGKDVAFQFVRAGNMKSPNESHMHQVTYTFVDNDNLKTTWINYVDGKPAGDMVFEMTRKK
jgi:hypothetical protein